MSLHVRKFNKILKNSLTDLLLCRSPMKHDFLIVIFVKISLLSNIKRPRNV